MADRRIVIDPLPEDGAIQPASIDLHLSRSILLYPLNQTELDPLKPSELEKYDICPYYWLDADEFVLGSTIERVELPSDIYARVEGKSSLGRCGLQVHVTAGFIDPGFCGNITLEIKNVNMCIINLRPGMPIAQICFGRLDGRVVRPYGSDGLGSKYQGSRGTIGPKAR